MSDNLCILAFNIRVTQFLDLTILKVIDNGHDWGKSLMLVVGDKSLSQFSIFVFVIYPRVGEEVFG